MNPRINVRYRGCPVYTREVSESLYVRYGGCPVCVREVGVSLYVRYCGCPVCVTEVGESSYKCTLSWMSCMGDRSWWALMTPRCTSCINVPYWGCPAWVTEVRESSYTCTLLWMYCMRDRSWWALVLATCTLLWLSCVRDRSWWVLIDISTLLWVDVLYARRKLVSSIYMYITVDILYITLNGCPVCVTEIGESP